MELKELYQEIILDHGKNPRNFFPWKLYFADIFRKKGGFDILIGNPPYLNSKKIDKKERL